MEVAVMKSEIKKTCVGCVYLEKSGSPRGHNFVINEFICLHPKASASPGHDGQVIGPANKGFMPQAPKRCPKVINLTTL